MNQTSVTVELPPQKNVLCLADAEDRTNFWRQAIKNFYEDPNDLPHGFFIPLADILQLATDFAPYGIEGVRAYFTLDEPVKWEEEGKAPRRVSAVLVPVVPDDLPGGIYRDLIIPVVAAPDATGNVVKEAVSVYDVTSPCPPCCDLKSPLH